MKGITVLGSAHIHMHDVVAVLRSRQDVRCFAVWDPVPDRARDWASLLGAEVATDSAEACAMADVAAVAVLSETCDHEPLVRSAVDAGKAVFVEKPLATSAEVAHRIADVVEHSGQRFDAGYFLRDVPAVVQLRQLVQAGALGRVERMRGRFSHEGARLGWFDEYDWVLDPSRAGYGALGDLGIHLLDLATWLTDEGITEVRAAAHRIDEQEGVDQYGVGVLRLEGGARVDVFASWVDPQDDVLWEVSGTEGRAWIERGELRVEGPAGLDVPAIPATPPSARTSLDRCLDGVGGRPATAPVDVRTAACHCELIDAMYRSAGQDAWIAV